MAAQFDRITLLTGATDGIGKYMAYKLAAMGGTVLIHGRNKTKLDAVVAELQGAFPDTFIEAFLADFSDLRQVSRMAKDISVRYERIDVLINNAGIGFGAPGSKRELSRDGYELRFAVNYLAPYLLTRKLLPRLRISKEGRIVNVVSIGQMPIDFNNIMLDHGYDGIRAYCQSKLAFTMASFDWADELRPDGITVNAVHPATYIDTQMVHEAGVRPQATIAQGSEPVLWLATSPQLRTTTGQFFNQRVSAKANAQAYEQKARHALHAKTEDLLRSFGVA